ncbi:MAG: sensor histidine kinase [Geobacteraceae bacterium]|nr:sensor histidine kinase [Geobacteraceae bacterium]
MGSAPARISIIAILILCISLLHYLTPLHLHYLHDIFQRFYYIPIILSALWFGFRGGLASAIAVSIIYTPHILFQWGDHVSMEIEKYLEIVLYNIVGGITGLLAQREKERSIELQKTAKGLEESYQKLQLQSERILVVEEQLRRAERLSTLGEMGAVLAHEIRNPLGSIRGTAEILKDDFPPGSAKHEFIEIQIKETERLNNVVEDFLRMARQQPLELKECSIAEELRTIFRLAENQAKTAGVRIVPAFTADGLPIKGDGEKLRQAFLNIMINAIQATPPDGSVTIALERSDSGVAITFSDSGIGIATEELEKIFEPFYTTKSDGTGLGLAITRKIIEGHGGRIDICSEKGKGTQVCIRLPGAK